MGMYTIRSSTPRVFDSVFEVVKGWVRLEPSRYIAIAFNPPFHACIYAFSISPAVASAGRFTVFEIAPEMNGWTAAIMRTWPRYCIDRMPFEGLNAQSKTGKD